MDIKKIQKLIPKENIYINEPMSKHTSFKIGGPAECFIKAQNIEQLKNILEYAKKENIKLTIIGNGSNILVSDQGIQGIVLKIDTEKLEEKIEDEKIILTVGSGVKLGALAQKCLKEEITGLEFASGIPGTIGGAIRMNAGAHGREMKDVIKTVKCLDYYGNEKTFTNEEMNFGYRTSILKTEKYIVTEVEIELDKGNSEEIKEKMDMYKEKRKNSQPLEYPSAGSTFKRGEDFITAKLIDEAGLKGTKVGDAEVSRKHGGFIINKGNATASDILELVQIIKNKIYEKYQKKIELEVEVLGEE